MLVDCPSTQRFWRSFRTWWFIMTKLNLNNFSRKSILYGYFRPCKFKSLTNLALLVAKIFIYNCFFSEKSLHSELYKLHLREKALTVQLIATKNNTIIVFDKKWQPFISSNFNFMHSLTRSHSYLLLLPLKPISLFLLFILSFQLVSNKCMFFFCSKAVIALVL